MRERDDEVERPLEDGRPPRRFGEQALRPGDAQHLHHYLPGIRAASAGARPAPDAERLPLMRVRVRIHRRRRLRLAAVLAAVIAAVIAAVTAQRGVHRPNLERTLARLLAQQPGDQRLHVLASFEIPRRGVIQVAQPGLELLQVGKDLRLAVVRSLQPTETWFSLSTDFSVCLSRACLGKMVAFL